MSEMLRRYLMVMMLASAVALAADDPGGWTTAKWGMSTDQVRAAIPSSHDLTGPADNRTFDGKLSTLGVDRVQIGRTVYSALFMFDVTGLSAVYLLPADESDRSLFQFIQVELLLVQKYGRPFERSYTEGRFAQWSLDTTTVTLHYSDIRILKRESLYLIYARKSVPATL
jgi:hypothetical protein